MDVWIDMNGGECMEIHGWMEVDGQMHGWTDAWMDVQMDGWKWMHG